MWLLLACTEPVVQDTAWERGPNPYSLDDQLRLNHVQAEGSHNSTHIEPDDPVDDSHRYTHASLGDQLGLQGVRQVELDLHLTEDGTWQIFHLPVVDAETTCLLLTDCLQELKDWSNQAEWGLPTMVWLEPKDDVDHMVEGLQSIEEYDTLEETILSVWPRERILTPDDVRGDHDDLPAALAADGWPTLDRVRGGVVFALLDSGAHRDAYLDGAPALEGRLLFVDSSAMDEPFAAMLKDGSPSDVEAWVEAGFLVTVNARGAGDDPDEGQAAFDAQLAAGAHFIATDFPDEVVIPDGSPARCNPVAAPEVCTSEALEVP